MERFLPSSGSFFEQRRWLDRLLSLGNLNPDARYFMHNLRSIYLQSAKECIGARKSYELALEESGHGWGINRHAMRNLAALLHLHTFPLETEWPDFAILEQAIELYRAAIGRDDSS